MVDASQMSAATLKQRNSILSRLCDFTDPDGTRYGDCDMVARQMHKLSSVFNGTVSRSA